MLDSRLRGNDKQGIEYVILTMKSLKIVKKTTNIIFMVFINFMIDLLERCVE